MATVSQLVDAVSVVTMVDRKTVNVYARALIDAEVLPKSKGKAIPHVNREHVVNLLLAIALQPTIKTVAEAIKHYSALEAKTNIGTLSAMDVLADLFGAATAGGVSAKDWHDVSFKVYENRIGIDVHLPGGRCIIFRVPDDDDLDRIVNFFISPNHFFSRSANVSFAGMLFLCQVMHAKNEKAMPQGIACVERLVSLEQIDAPTDSQRVLSIIEDVTGEGATSIE